MDFFADAAGFLGLAVLALVFVTGAALAAGALGAGAAFFAAAAFFGAALVAVALAAGFCEEIRKACKRKDTVYIP